MSGIVDASKIGHCIQFLRKRAGYTQLELANRLAVTDKAISKWERGIGVPDISLLRKISIILDVDIDSLLEGEVAFHENVWKGLLVLDDMSTVKILDAPMLDHMLCLFILAKIRDILILCNNSQREFILKHYGTGENLGINLNCIVRTRECLSDAIFKHKESFASSNVMIVHGSLFLYGVDLTRFLRRGLISSEKLIALSIVKNSAQHKVYIDSEKRIVCADSKTWISTKYNYCYLPILFCHGGIRRLLKWNFPDYDALITTLIQSGELYAELMDKGFLDIMVQDADSVLAVSELVKSIQELTGCALNNPAEIAYRRGLIEKEALMDYAEKSPCCSYLKSLVQE